MMKKTILAAMLALSSLASASTTLGEQPMKLVNSKSGYVVIEFVDGQVKFHDRFLEAEMKETGILIPPALTSQFEGKETIFYGDPLFEKAFLEVYYPLCISSSVYEWQN